MQLMKIKNVRMGLLSCFFLFFLYSCEVDKIEPAKPVEEENMVDSTDVNNEDEHGQESASMEKDDREVKVIGTGSGNIKISDSDRINYTIRPGTYSYVEIKNVNNSVIDGFEKVKVSGSIVSLSNLENVTIQNINIEDSPRGIVIDDSANNLTLNNLRLKNTPGISFRINKKFNGSPSSYSENIHLTNISAENITSLFQSHGGLKDDGFYGLIKGLKIKNNIVRDSPNYGSGVYVNLAEDFEISGNVIDHVNAGHDSHNGIFHVKGNGKIFDNKVTNHSGNAVRSWLFSITKPNSVIEIYNNIVYNSERYSAFEVQVTPGIKQMDLFKPANAKIYNNTVGKMNSGPKYYEGRVVDIYQTYGIVEVYNNLYFDMRDNIVSLNQSSPAETVVKETNNKYFENAKDAVVDLTSFKSKIAGIGAQ